MVNADWHSFCEMSDFVPADPSWCTDSVALLTEQGVVSASHAKSGVATNILW